MMMEEEGNWQTLMKFVEEKLNIREEDPLLEMKRTVDKGFENVHQKSLLRRVYIIIDTSQTCTRVDFKPSRIGLTQLYLRVRPHHPAPPAFRSPNARSLVFTACFLEIHSELLRCEPAKRGVNWQDQHGLVYHALRVHFVCQASREIA